MNLNPSFLFVSFLLGAVGVFYLMYGKRRQDGWMRGCGLGLVICPMLLPKLVWLLPVGLLLCFLPTIVKRYF